MPWGWVLGVALLAAPVQAQEFTSALKLAKRNSALKSLVIAGPRSILAEHHNPGAGLDRPTNVKSVSKSLVSALVGIAIGEEKLRLDQQIAGFFPDYAQYFQDADRRSITIEDLLTMRSGLETTSFYNYGRWVAGPDWIKGQLEQPVIARPGTQMKYSTGASHLMSVILERALEVSTRTFAQRRLARPLTMGQLGWEEDPLGYDFGGNNLTMTPRQMVQLGQLYLNDGVWNGKRILPEGWVEASWTPRTRSPWNGYSYGYFWWLRTMGGEPVAYAWGHGGQRIFVLPELDLVVVLTAKVGPGGRSRGEMMDFTDRVLVDYIIPEARLSP